MVSQRPIALVGMMGAGKSTVARILGARLSGTVSDLDAVIEAEAGVPVAEIFRREGEAGFRRRERQCLGSVLARRPAVLACGGGVVVDPDHRAALKRTCRVVWLEVSPEEAARRVGGAAPDRPLLPGDGPGLLALLRQREPAYAEVAELRVATDGRTPEEVAMAVMAGLGLARGSAPC